MQFLYCDVVGDISYWPHPPARQRLRKSFFWHHVHFSCFAPKCPQRWCPQEYALPHSQSWCLPSMLPCIVHTDSAHRHAPLSYPPPSHLTWGGVYHVTYRLVCIYTTFSPHFNSKKQKWLILHIMLYPSVYEWGVGCTSNSNQQLEIHCTKTAGIYTNKPHNELIVSVSEHWKLWSSTTANTINKFTQRRRWTPSRAPLFLLSWHKIDNEFYVNF